MITIDFVDEARIPAEKPNDQRSAVEREAMRLSDRFKTWARRTGQLLQRAEPRETSVADGEQQDGDGCFWKTASLVDRYVQRVG